MITKILIVDDSATQRQVLREMLAQDPEFEVVGEAADGLEALELCHRLQPDLVTMDIQMPRMNGYEAIRRIMSETPRPVVVLTSSFSDRMLGISFKALDSGALMVLGKPASLSMPQEEKGRLLGQLKAMAGVKVVGRRWNRLDRPAAHREPIKASPRAGRSPVELICLGASTGGPPAVQGILQGLSPESTPPIALVQHINLGFVDSLARWLSETTGFMVEPAKMGCRLQPGKVILAPEKRHLTVLKGGMVRLIDADLVDGHRPSVTALFRSAAVYGSSAVGVLLTGMGRDGAQGLLEMKNAGAWTIAQNRETSVVYGMPGEAVALGGANEVLPLGSIANRITKMCASGKEAHNNGK
ncbi:MAG: chemotaxis-specific protein-glutamate methyltransferase CheB [Desulfarculaceae bacterium]|nr:chemotaxis-specific protein-glutamate methyltransferase CheB [Desulfarculaceae bacterium]MCF8046163.1 chemotaxis-specific protein-glutamate methyltransferase CheB [Desulfarculaceae bacterium]MCF8065829.1 chemotaxis-specific protein-glutamate methyltransferase CheB [Desulfarculaceae bacterium]MCF8097965.1 chemotaxis-specific protein-glutamate methyltransferase CheB [Desulfarculaceae bacterium]MCF8123988.1 chemotaxis-specific protein-glutamate methyltransferase CheB [Desulfarculaceae bacterium